MTLPATRILLCDDLDPIALEVLRARGFEPEVRVGLDEDELVRAVPGVHAIVVRSSTRVTERVLAAADRLEVVGRAGVGVDNVDARAATVRGVVVMNTPTGNTTTTAELAIALLASLARHVPRADRAVRAGTWSKKGLVGTEITGKTLGVIGLGRIGRVVAERAQGLAMHVIAADPYLAKTGVASPVPGVDLVELDELLARSDFVTLHVPLNESTRNLLSRERLARMKPGARLVNAARGGLVDEEALAEALDSGHLAGAALDVLATEPPPPGHPLLGREDVILTPHLGASSQEAQKNVARDIAEQIATYFLEGVAHNAVNAPALSAATLAAMRHHVLLAERMGAFLAQRMDEPIAKIEFSVGGEVAARDDGYLALSFLVSVLRQSLDVGVNFVNAPVLARERGIRLFEDRSADAGAYTSLMEARVWSRDGRETHRVAGTVFGVEPRFVKIDSMSVDLVPEGVLLVTLHDDRPGVFGALGTLLGRNGINILRVELGPGSERTGGLASAFLTLAERPSDPLLDEIRALGTIEYARVIAL